jgi:WD40-like Beta Propeller Repeat
MTRSKGGEIQARLSPDGSRLAYIRQQVLSQAWAP